MGIKVNHSKFYNFMIGINSLKYVINNGQPWKLDGVPLQLIGTKESEKYLGS